MTAHGQQNPPINGGLLINRFGWNPGIQYGPQRKSLRGAGVAGPSLRLLRPEQDPVELPGTSERSQVMRYENSYRD